MYYTVCLSFEPVRVKKCKRWWNQLATYITSKDSELFRFPNLFLETPRILQTFITSYSEQLMSWYYVNKPKLNYCSSFIVSWPDMSNSFGLDLCVQQLVLIGCQYVVGWHWLSRSWLELAVQQLVGNGCHPVG